MDGLYQFLEDLEDALTNWDEDKGILGININSGSGKGDEREEVFIKDYGTFTLEQVVESKLIHIDDESWLTQYTYMPYF